MAEGRHRPVTGHEMSVVAHWPKALGDRIEQLLVIAAREVRSSDRSLEQYVADDRELRFGMVEHDMARRVARAMADVEGQVADRDSVAVDQIAVGLKWLAFYAVAMAVILQPGDPKQILLMRPFDRHSQFLRQNPGLPAMVDVAVGQQDLLDLHAMLRGGCLETRQIAPRIDESAEHRLGAPQQRAILLQGSHRDDCGAERLVGHLAGSTLAMDGAVVCNERDTASA